MQPVQAVKDVGLPVATATENKPQEEGVVCQPENPKQAEDLQEMFIAGAQSGGVARPNPIEELERAAPQLSLDAYVKSVLGEVSQGVQAVGLPTFLQVTPEAVSAYLEKASTEEKALFGHFTDLLLAHYMPIVEALPDPFKPFFSLAIQNALTEKMPQALDEIRKISPEFLQNVTAASQFKTHIAKLGQVMAQLEVLSCDVLQNLADALQNEDKDSFIATSDEEAIQNLTLFLAEIPEQIHAGIVDGVLAGIKDVLTKK